MKNVALIIAGGTGSRMGSEVPKQFINVDDKPVIIHTLEHFQSHIMIDSIVVVCLKGWEGILKVYCNQYGIDKLEAIVPNGSTGMESLKNGIDYIKEEYDFTDRIIIHDGVRPLVDESIISDLIAKSEENEYGNSASTTPINEQIFTLKSDGLADNFISRDQIIRMVTPQAYKVGNIYTLFKEAFEKDVGIGAGTYANTLAVLNGQTITCSAGSEMNIKLTTKENLDMFKLLLKLNK